jgi:hypothetical protein
MNSEDRITDIENRLKTVEDILLDQEDLTEKLLAIEELALKQNELSKVIYDIITANCRITERLHRQKNCYI